MTVGDSTSSISCSPLVIMYYCKYTSFETALLLGRGLASVGMIRGKGARFAATMLAGYPTRERVGAYIVHQTAGRKNVLAVEVRIVALVYLAYSARRPFPNQARSKKTRSTLSHQRNKRRLDSDACEWMIGRFLQISIGGCALERQILLGARHKLVVESNGSVADLAQHQPPPPPPR